MVTNHIKPPMTTDKSKLWLCFVPPAPMVQMAWFGRRWYKLGFWHEFGRTACLLVLIYMAFAPLFILTAYAAVHFQSVVIFWPAVYLMQTVTALLWREVEYRRLSRQIERYKAGVTH